MARACLGGVLACAPIVEDGIRPAGIGRRDAVAPWAGRLRAMTFAVVPLMTGAPDAHADTIFEVEHARAIARAGGPVSDFDAELLERYGELSGTPDWRSRRERSFRDGNGPRPRKARRKRPASGHD